MIRTGLPLTKDATVRERIERIAQIAHDVSVFCINVHAVHVSTETYAFNAGGAHAHELAELGGVVKHQLLDGLNIVTDSIPAATARKTMLQKLPRSDVKAFVTRNVRRLGGLALEWTHDEIDALVICNHALMKAGFVAVERTG
jgi:archaellum biogenesis ATPase FlaH